MSKINAVFEGGGIKGIGLVGAVAVVEEAGYTFENVAGTSAGAIVAALIAAGYTASETKDILESLDYENFKDARFPAIIPGIGPVFSILSKKGIFEGEFFKNWLTKLLADKGVEKFGDLVIEEYAHDPKYRYKLQVVAADMTSGKMIVLPRDIKDYDYDPDSLDVASAARMSMSIPFFFKPVVLKNSQGKSFYIVDGGVLSNFPVWLFDEENDVPAWPTFGFKLVEPTEGQPNPIKGPISLLLALFSTMMEAHDARYIQDHQFARTVPIPTLGVRTTEFDLSAQKSKALYESGEKAAKKFLSKWDFKDYLKNHGQDDPPSRSDRVFAK